MSERYITVTEDQLWIVVNDVHPDYDDGLITIRECSGGNALVSRDEIPALISILPGIERVTWNTEKRAIAAGVTRPLQVTLVPDVWSQLARRDIPVDDWLVDEREQTEEVDAWAK